MNRARPTPTYAGGKTRRPETADISTLRRDLAWEGAAGGCSHLIGSTAPRCRMHARPRLVWARRLPPHAQSTASGMALGWHMQGDHMAAMAVEKGAHRYQTRTYLGRGHGVRRRRQRHQQQNVRRHHHRALWLVLRFEEREDRG